MKLEIGRMRSVHRRGGLLYTSGHMRLGSSLEQNRVCLFLPVDLLPQSHRIEYVQSFLKPVSPGQACWAETMHSSLSALLARLHFHFNLTVLTKPSLGCTDRCARARRVCSASPSGRSRSWQLVVAVDRFLWTFTLAMPAFDSERLRWLCQVHKQAVLHPIYSAIDKASSGDFDTE